MPEACRRRVERKVGSRGSWLLEAVREWHASEKMITEISSDDNWIRRSLRDTGDPVAVDTVEKMQIALDAYLVTHNTSATDQGRGHERRTPYRAFLDPANDNSQEDTDRKPNQADAA
jgi:hypothetical protein